MNAWSGRVAVIGLAMACVLISAPAGAEARTLHAKPKATGGDPCRKKDPCSLKRAVRVANRGDAVKLSRGRFEIPGLVIEKAIKLQGARRGRSRIASPVYVDSAGARLADLTLPQGLDRLAGAGDRLVSRLGCGLQRKAVLRNSICEGGIGGLTLNGAPLDALLVNVTAIGNGASGIAIAVGAAGNIDARIRGINVIAFGNEADISATAFFGTASIELTYSNFDSRETGASPSGVASATAPGSPTNQTALPRFRETHDYRQRPSSPTVDAGTPDAATGVRDFERDRRRAGSAPDIGADELIPR